MANGTRQEPGGDERDNQWGYGRTQPEFSLGERMATMEANQRKDIEHAKEMRNADEEHRKEITKVGDELVKEQLKGVRQEMTTKDTAQKEATTKAEKSAADTASALATELKSSRETTDARLGAIERGGAGIGGEKLGAGELQVREQTNRAERRAEKATQISVGTIIIAGIALLRAAGII